MAIRVDVSLKLRSRELGLILLYDERLAIPGLSSAI